MSIRTRSGAMMAVAGSLLFTAAAWAQDQAAAATPPAADSGSLAAADSGGLSETVANGTRAAEDVLAFITRLAAEYGFKVLGALVILAVAWVAAGWARSVTRRGLDRAKFEPTIAKFAANAAKYLVLLIGVLSSLPLFGVNITALAALVGAGGLAVGLASQGALSNLAAGLMLLITRPFRVGDVIVVDGFSGIVDEIELFTTKLNTPDNRRIIMPNNSIFGKVIENVTHNPARRVPVSVGVAYDTDLDAARAALLRAAASVPTVSKEPGPSAGLTGLADSSINWDVHVWCKASDFGATRDQLIRAIKTSLDQAGINIPFPQRDVHVYHHNAPGGAAGAASTGLVTDGRSALPSVN